MKFLQGCIKYLIGCVNLWSQFQRKGGNSGYDSGKFAKGVNSGDSDSWNLPSSNGKVKPKQTHRIGVKKLEKNIQNEKK